MSTAPFTYDVQCPQCPLRPCEVFRPISDDELGFISSLKTGEIRTGPGATVLREGTQTEHLFTVLEGWARQSSQHIWAKSGLGHLNRNRLSRNPAPW
jgi:hypothetical protein